MERVENRMVNPAVWPDTPPEVKEKLRGPGYRSMDGVFVPEEDAYTYALERISQDEALQKELVEWFYSGEWVKEE